MKKSLPYLIIALVVIIAFAQVAFLTETLKYDILDGYLPGHYFLSECLRNGIFPLWNPYQQLGYPAFADMLTSNYVVDMLIGRFFPYTNITFNILFIIYVIISGWGAWLTALEFRISRQFSLLIAIAYSLSGFITGNAQHIQFMAGAAWLPPALLYFVRLSRSVKLKDALFFVLFTILLITGGYPSFAIFLAYILFFAFSYYLFNAIRQKNFTYIKGYIALCALALLLVTVLCSGVFISLWQATPHVERYVKLAYDYSVTNPFPPVALLSAISPLATAAHPALFGTDLSMNNHYFGVILIPFFIYALLRRGNLLSYLMLAIAVFVLLFSFGEHFFIHRLFYEHVPLFNKFRHPSSFRFITILFLLLFTGYQATQHDPRSPENFTLFKRIFIGFFMLIFLACLITAIQIIRLAKTDIDFSPEWGRLLTDYGIAGPVFIQATVILLLTFLFLYFIIIKARISLFYPLLSVILITEAVVFTQMNMRISVTSAYNPKEISSFLRNRPSGFPLPDENRIGDNSEESVEFIPLINNTNTYAKTVSPWFMYPFYLDGFKTLQQDTILFRQVINHKLLYFEEATPNNNDSIICTRFSPQYMEFETSSDKDQTAILLQNNFPGWQVEIDGKVVKHFTVKKSLIGASVPAGKHLVAYTFSNPLYIKATLISFVLIIVIVLVILAIMIKENKTGSRKYIYITTGILLLLISIWALLPARSFREKLTQNNREIAEYVNKTLKPDDQETLLLLNTESPNPFDTQLNGQTVWKRFRFQKDVIELHNMLDTVNAEKLVYIWSNVLEVPGTREVMLIKFPVIKSEFSGHRFTVLELSAQGDRTKSGKYFINTYDTISPEWNLNGVIMDTVNRYSGKLSEKLEGEREFSSTLRHKLKENPATGIRVFASVFFNQNNNQSVHLVISVNRKGRTVHYYPVDLSQFKSVDREWNFGFASTGWLKSSLRKGDEIVVYFWNSGKNEAVYLDDFFVSIK